MPTSRPEFTVCVLIAWAWLRLKAVTMLLLQPRSSYSVVENSPCRNTWGKCCSRYLKEHAFRQKAHKPKSVCMYVKYSLSCISNRSASAADRPGESGTQQLM